MKRDYIFKALTWCVFSIALFTTMAAVSSCESDDDNTAPDGTLVNKAKTFLTGDIVIYTTAVINDVDKTLLPTGCPAKYNFKWDNNNKDKFTITLTQFHVGAMPVMINFTCDVKMNNLKTSDKDIYKGEGWLAFDGVDGKTWFGDGDASTASVTKGSKIDGYYNVNSQEINFKIDYNSMNAKTYCKTQVVDKSLLNNFDALFTQYQEDLTQYKKDHGLQ